MQFGGRAVPGPGLAGRLAPDGGSVAAAASDPSLSSSRRRLCSSWKLHPAVTDGKFRGACNISEKTFHRSSRMCRAEAKQRETLFGWKRCPLFYSKSMPTCRMWPRGTEHRNCIGPSHRTQKLTLFTGLALDKNQDRRVSAPEQPQFVQRTGPDLNLMSHWDAPPTSCSAVGSGTNRKRGEGNQEETSF